MAERRIPEGSHVDEATFERLALNEVGADERAALFDHITACASCTRVWRAVLELGQEADAAGLLPPGVTSGPTWRSPMIALAVAATLVVVVGGALLSRLGVDDSITRRGGETVVLGDLSTRAGIDGRPVFSWSPVAAATGYRVDVFTEDGQVVWSRDVTGPPLSWPAEAPPPAGAYRWRVEARADNAVVARSRLADVEVAR